MNIDEYRAMKAELEQAQEEPTQEQEPEVKEEDTLPQDEPSQEGKEDEAKSPEEEPNEKEQDELTIEIDGKTYTLEELKQGYMRQADYTRKTQELSRKEREAQEALKLIEELQKNPQVAQELSQQFELPNLDPVQSQFKELESRYYDLLIQTELRDLHDKYGEFDDASLLQIARDEGVANLDTAYHIMVSREGGGAHQPVDVDSLKEQLRQELLSELKAEQQAQVDTTTIIDGGGGVAPRVDNEPKLSPAEQKVARSMGMSIREYAKWRSAGKRKR